MSDTLVYRRKNETITFCPCGDKNIVVMMLDTPETARVIRKIEKIGFRNEGEENG